MKSLKDERRRRREYMRRYRAENPEQNRAYQRQWFADNPNKLAYYRLTQRGKKMGAALWYKMTHPCVDCGESDPVVLEFDHVIGVKKSAVSRIANSQMSLQALLAEIQKCDVVCANCHRRRTDRRRRRISTFRQLMSRK